MEKNLPADTIEVGEEPTFLEAFRAIAARKNISLEEAIAAEQAQWESSPYPTKDCLLPEEAVNLLLFFQAEPTSTVGHPQVSLIPRPGASIDADIQRVSQHVQDCPHCVPMMLGMQASRTFKERFLDVAQARAREHRSVPVLKEKSSLERLSSTGVWGALAGVILFGAAAWFLPAMPNGTLALALYDVIKSNLLRWGASAIIGTFIVLVLSYQVHWVSSKVWPSLSSGWKTLEWTRGFVAAAIGSALVGVVVFYQALAVKSDVVDRTPSFEQVAAAELKRQVEAESSRPAQTALAKANPPPVITVQRTVTHKQTDRGTLKTDFQPNQATVLWTVDSKEVPQSVLKVGGLHLSDNNVLEFIGKSDDHPLPLDTSALTQPMKAGDTVIAKIVETHGEDRARVVEMVPKIVLVSATAR